MEKIYIDPVTCHCSRTCTDGAVLFETDFFDGKCDAYVEGFAAKRQDNATAYFAWKPYPELAAAQAQYEADLAEASAAYQEGVESAWI